MLVDLLKAQGKEVVAAESRIENITDVSKVLFDEIWGFTFVSRHHIMNVLGAGRGQANSCPDVCGTHWTTKRRLVRIQQGRHLESQCGQHHFVL